MARRAWASGLRVALFRLDHDHMDGCLTDIFWCVGLSFGAYACRARCAGMAHKVRRGAAGKIRSGQRAGGVAYGYRPVPGKPGESTIYEPEAEVVRRIFGSCADGKTPREIAGEQNADRVPTPRGGVWRASTLGGGRKRGDGMLAN